MKTLPEPPTRGAFLLVLVLVASGLGGLADLGTQAWRLGGGVALLASLLLAALVAVPVWLAEVALGRASGRPLPGALHEAAGGFGELVGWLALACAGLATVALGARGAIGLSLGATGWLDLPAGPGLLSLGAASLGWALAGYAAASPARLTRLLQALGLGFALLAALGLALALAAPDGAAAALSLLRPRPGALAHPETWTGALSRGLLMAGAGLGLGAGLGRDLLPRRGGVVRLALLSALLGAACQGLLSLTGFALLATHAPELAAARPLGLPLPPGADLRGLDGALAWLGFAAVAAAITRAGAVSLADRYPLDLARGARGLALLGALGTLSLLATGPPDAQGAGLSALVAAMLLNDALGVGLPATGLLFCGLLVGGLDLPALLRRVDLEGGPRLAPWLPFAVGRVAPAALALLLAVRLALPDSQRALLRDAASAAPLSAGLQGVLHVVVPVGALLAVFILASALTWLAPTPAVGPRRTA